jgi:hypothetical protein
VSHSFACIASVELGEWCDEHEMQLLQTIGRRPDWSGSGDGSMIYKWFCDTLSSARLLADAAREISGVTAVARER